MSFFSITYLCTRTRIYYVLTVIFYIQLIKLFNETKKITF